VTDDKGLVDLLLASAHISPSHQLLIAGTGPSLEDLQALAGALGIRDHTRFVGRVDQDDIPALLQLTDVFVLPSVSTARWREPWGLVVNEAMNCGVPVIATDGVGAAAGGLVIDGQTGRVVPQRNARALAAALNELLEDEDARRRLGEQGKQHVLDWNYDAAADAFEAALRAVTTQDPELLGTST